MTDLLTPDRPKDFRGFIRYLFGERWIKPAKLLKHRSRPELRLTIAKILAWQTLGQVDEKQWWDEEKVWKWVVENNFVTEYLEKADQLLLLLSDGDEIKSEERERLSVIIEDYQLDRASVRDDVLERQANGWKVLKQALKQGEK